MHPQSDKKSGKPLGETRSAKNKGSYQSGQMGQTVNLLAYAFGGSNPSLPTLLQKKEAVSIFIDTASFICTPGLEAESVYSSAMAPRSKAIEVPAGVAFRVQ